MCGREAGRPLQRMRFCHGFNDLCGLLPSIPLVKVSPIETSELIDRTYAKEKMGVRIGWGKLTVCLGIQETNLVQGHPDGV